MCIRDRLPGAAERVASSLPEGSPQSPAMTAESIADALAGRVWFSLLLGLAVYAIILVGLARRSNTARVVGAVFAAASILGTLLGTLRLFVFPAGDVVLPLVLAGLSVLLNAAWLACAFNPGVATTFLRRRA